MKAKPGLMRSLLSLAAIGAAIAGFSLASQSLAVQPHPETLPKFSPPPEDGEDINKTQQLNQQIHQLYYSGQYAAALPLARTVFKIRQKNLGLEHLSTIKSLNNLALLHFAQGQYSTSEPLFQQALEIRQKQLPQKHPALATNLNTLARLYQAQAKYPQAGQLFKQALELRQASLKPSHPTVLQSRIHLAKLHQDRGDFPSARHLYENVSEKLNVVLESEEIKLPKDFKAISILLNRAIEQESRGNYAAAEKLRQQALAIQTVAPEPNPELLAQTLPVNEELGLPDELIVTDILHTLGLLNAAQGQPLQAETYLRSAILLNRETLGFKHPNFANHLHSLAEFLANQGSYLHAEFLYRCILEIQEKTFAPGIHEEFNTCKREKDPLDLSNFQLAKHPQLAKTLHNLAELYSRQGHYEIAEGIFLQTLDIREDPKVLGPNHPEVATTLHGLGVLNLNRENYRDAKFYLESARTIRERAVDDGTFDPKNPDLAQSYSGLGEYHKARGNYPEAESYFKQVLEIVEDLFGSDPVVALALDLLGDLQQEQGNYEEAESYHQQALEIRLASLGDNHPDVAESYKNLAWLSLAKGETDRAIAYMTQAAEIEDKNLGSILATGSETRKRAYMETLVETTNGAIALHVQHAPDNPEAARLALTSILRRKGRVIDALAGSLEQLRDRLSEREPNRLSPQDRELLKLLDELNSVRSQLATLIYTPPRDKDNLSEYQQRWGQLKTKEEELADKLARRSATFAAQSEPEITLDRIQHLIPQNAALVELILYQPVDPKTKKRGESRYVAYILHPQGELQWVELGEADEIDDAIGKFREAMQSPNDNVEAIAREVDWRVMQPIREHLKDAQVILLSPDSQLNLVPFAALVDENSRYLVDRYTFNYLDSGRDLLRLQEATPSQESLILLANPDYDRSGETPAETASDSSEQDLQRLTNVTQTPWEAFASATLPFFGRSLDMQWLNFGPLPGTEAEATGITQLLPEFSLLTEAQATENFVKRLQAPKILHIATHGFFLETELGSSQDRADTSSLVKDEYILAVEARSNSSPPKPHNLENPLLRSGIALAGFNERKSGSEDGVLTALEVAGLNLDGTDLVVLSACETGLGDVNNGDGVYGLRRAIAIAGADSQLVSLWKVDDFRTKELMVNYYEHLKRGLPRSEALRQVQREMLHSSEYQHPYYWSAFIPSGDWQPVFTRF